MNEMHSSEYDETINLCPDADLWDPYNEEYDGAEDSFLYFRGELIQK